MLTVEIGGRILWGSVVKNGHYSDFQNMHWFYKIETFSLSYAISAILRGYIEDKNDFYVIAMQNKFKSKVISEFLYEETILISTD